MSINSVFEMDAVNIIIHKIIMNIFHLFFYFQNFKNNQIVNAILETKPIAFIINAISVKS
ncbi:hypothetical protein HMPREF9430_00126 [Solobacterium moorei F0204]|uniref:Uncharacterized protein n=1 Tax=Solobacterium moorei F0204 TaxID=706433 RepID=E7MKT1_9FIRM|nr:hypothetical protein HMPREF9430_00126 [Solobacterium moorei F0204]